MESSSAAFSGTPSAASFASTEHHCWIFMFAAESPFNIVSRVEEDKIHDESITLLQITTFPRSFFLVGDWQVPPSGPKGERFPSTELEFTNRTTLEIRDGHGKALTVMTFTIPGGPTSAPASSGNSGVSPFTSSYAHYSATVPTNAYTKLTAYIKTNVSHQYQASRKTQHRKYKLNAASGIAFSGAPSFSDVNVRCFN
ncbi:hypothetical protein F5H01DRAFT_323906 [Linnemannia elongata]|nr:hypothetical protein F5H01DRAFT_323906 [Linnemannia elongata]